MSNVKSATIVGTLPFNAHEINPEMDRLYAQLNRPAEGLRLSWADSGKYVPNETLGAPETNPPGGKTAIYSFSITGMEASSWKWFEWVKAQIVAAKGTIEQWDVRDIEDG